MYADVRGARLFFDVDGAGLVRDRATMRHKPVLFVVPGGPGGDHSRLKATLAPLADKAQLVYFDYRGCGWSAPAPPGTHTMDTYVDDVEALRSHLGLDRIGLLGISYGGMVSMTYATRYQRHLSHLILVVTAPDHRFMTRAQEIAAERGTPRQQAAAARLFRGGFENSGQMRDYFETMGSMYAQHFDTAEEQSFQPRFNHEAINAAYGVDLHKYDVTDRLSGITVPTQVIGARHDWICAPEFSVEIADRIPGAQLRMFENSGHNVQDDEHGAFIDVVRGFLDHPPQHSPEEKKGLRMPAVEKYVKWDYTDLAATYTQRPSYAPGAIDRIVEATGKPGPRVADVGAGNAHLTVDLLARGCVVDAVEPNEAMRTIGIQRTEGGTVTWHVGVGEDTGLETDAYDLVTFGSSFATTDRLLALKETARILRERGWFTCIWNHRDLNDPIQNEVESIIRRHIPDYGYGVRREDQAPVIIESGLFEEPTTLREPVLHRVPVEDWLAAWRSHGILENQAGDKFPAILEDIDAYVRSLGSDELEIPYETVGWIARLRPRR
ncbi:proline-specific peptidase [Actinoplanes campanulatus]|uniref:Proline-specific peptidase n=1 Tax=Actinoplanes campanulatus TaxID=113559 RepID=A0A7W5FDH1_9ACTN|nr:alpha/beta fold hydrolase [Actinoplanes campanulatus]MBB3094286.1 proline-specific peptidase [Actinoplanes campanulatus]GGN19934.1 hypothetical protein GCM10010109_33540 [Actinoplanes campanulatus]GID35795.1 hypothetical protein Aca09nite_23010 [Actinoplanes campanulatus]